MTTEEKRKRLLVLGFRTPVHVAERVIARLKRHGTAYSLYHPKSNKLVTKDTATKFRDAWGRGDLWFLTEASNQNARISRRRLFVEVNECVLRSRAEVGLADNEDQSADRLLELTGYLWTASAMQFGEMNLVLGGSEIGAFKFGAGTLDFDAIYGGRRIPSNVVKGEATITPLFSIPTSLASGKQTAQLLVKADSKIWGSERFELDFERAGGWVGPITDAKLKERERLDEATRAFTRGDVAEEQRN